MIRSTRAGQYVKQTTGYRAFIPKPLPPDPPLEIDRELLELVSRADLALGRLDGSIQTLPDADLFVLMYVRKEAVLSSQIEGTQSSLNDVLEAEANVFRAGRPRDINEVINYINAMNYGLKRLEEIPVSVRVIREIHERLLRGVRGQTRLPGDLRTSQNWIGPAGNSLLDAVFVPPPPHEVPLSLSELEKFLHGDFFLPVLVKIALVHSQFETIHPFLDGNGRVGRLLTTFLLCANNVIQKPVLYLSHYFKKHRNEYYDLLQSVRDEGRWEAWVRFFLEAVAEVSREATETARHIVGLRENHRTVIIENFGRATANGLQVLESLYSRPLISINDIAAMNNVSFSAASQLMDRFVEQGILVEFTGQARNRRYRYADYIDLFSDQ